MITSSLSATVLVAANLARLGRVLVPKVLVPEHPAVVEGVAVGAVVVAVGRVVPVAVAIVVGLNLQRYPLAGNELQGL